MANKRLIDANAFIKEHCDECKYFNVDGICTNDDPVCGSAMLINEIPTVDAVEVVRCQNCVHAEPLDRNCELSTSDYMHCKLWRGEETKNVWHKYKKYYKDYSLVERDGYCDAGAKMDGGNEDDKLQ
jgi:hypothetical protein